MRDMIELGPSAAWLCEHDDPAGNPGPTVILRETDARDRLVDCPACGARYLVWTNSLTKRKTATAVVMPVFLPPCDEPGCTEPAIPCLLSGDDVPTQFWCAKHAFVHGFCIGCGRFFAGIDSFDFGNGYCDDCQDEIDADESDVDDDQGEFADDYDYDGCEDKWDEYADDGACTHINPRVA